MCSLNPERESRLLTPCSRENTFARTCTFDVVMDGYHLCALCGRQIRKVNGRWQRYVYEVKEGSVHTLGGREVRVKRSDPTHDYGCKDCYEELGATPVRTISHSWDREFLVPFFYFILLVITIFAQNSAVVMIRHFF